MVKREEKEGKVAGSILLLTKLTFQQLTFADKKERKKKHLKLPKN